MIKRIFKILLASLAINLAYAQEQASPQPQPQAKVWQWQSPCQVQDKVRCSVWFNHHQKFESISVLDGQNALATNLKSYGDKEVSSATALLFHLPGVSDKQLEKLHKQVDKQLKLKRRFQSFGIYLADSSLKVLAPVGAPVSALAGKVDDIAASQNGDAVDAVKKVSEIIGGNQGLKTIILVTTGFEINEGARTNLATALKGEKTRLVVVHLALNELALNSAQSVKQLAIESNGRYQVGQESDWQAMLALIHPYSINGADIVVDSNGLCGTKNLKFVAVFAGQPVNHEQSLEFAACAESEEQSQGESQTNSEETGQQQTQEETQEQQEQQEQQQEQEQSEDNQQQSQEDSGQDSESETTEEQGQQTETQTTEQSNEEEGQQQEGQQESGESTEESGTQETSSEESQEGDEGTAPAQPAEDKAIDPMLLAAAGIALVIIIILIVIVKNKNKKAATQASAADEDQPVRASSLPEANYGLLIESSPGGNISHVISAESFTVGRGEGNMLVLENDSVSAQHAAIKVERDGSITLIDLNSSNGTKVNGVAITKQRLNHDDIILFGEASMVFKQA